MPHLKHISMPKQATLISETRGSGSTTSINEDGVVPVLDTVFGFVLDLVTIKGKGSN